MVKIGVTEGGDPLIGKAFSYANIEDANSSRDIYAEDPVFGSAEHLRDYYAKTDLQLFSRRFCCRITTFDDLWLELQRRAVPGRFGEKQKSRKKKMVDTPIETPVKNKPIREKKERGAEKTPLDAFGLRTGTKSSDVAAFLTEGHSMAEVNEKFGDVFYNLLKRLGEMGHEVRKDGNIITLVANPDYVRPAKAAKAA